MRILVAGASGLGGPEIVRLLKADGGYIRALSRDPARAAALGAHVDDVRVADATRSETLHGTCDSIDVLISALGAPVSPTSMSRASFLETDLIANRALIDEARRAGVRRVVYVSVHSEPAYERTRYLRARGGRVGVASVWSRIRDH